MVQRLSSHGEALALQTSHFCLWKWWTLVLNAASIPKTPSINQYLTRELYILHRQLSAKPWSQARPRPFTSTSTQLTGRRSSASSSTAWRPSASGRTSWWRLRSCSRGRRTETNNIDRPTKHFLPLPLPQSGKWGDFCRWNKICIVNELFLDCF